MAGKQKVAVLEDNGQGVGLSGRYITVEEYAQQSGLSLATARRRAFALSAFMEAPGKPSSVKVGKQWLIRVGDWYR